MKIHYLATSNIPSKTANSLQIIKMCEAFSLIGKNISLIIPNLKNVGIKSVVEIQQMVLEYQSSQNNF